MGVETLLIAGAIASGVSAIESLSQGKRQAKAALREGEIQADNLLKATRQKAGSQRQSFLSSGLELSGSPLSAIQDTLKTGEEDIEQTLDNARVRAQNALAQGRAGFFQGVASASLGLAGGFGGAGSSGIGSNAFSANTAARTTSSGIRLPAGLPRSS